VVWIAVGDGIAPGGEHGVGWVGRADGGVGDVDDGAANEPGTVGGDGAVGFHEVRVGCGVENGSSWDDPTGDDGVVGA